MKFQQQSARMQYAEYESERAREKFVKMGGCRVVTNT